MTEEQFNTLKLGDYVHSNYRNETGQIVMGSYREWYVKYPSEPDVVYMYDPVEDDYPWEELTKI